MNTVVNKFIKNFSEIEEIDYGDFMRKANHYLLELEEDLSQSSNSSIKKNLEQMKIDVQYYPNWDIQSTRKKILEHVRRIGFLLDQSSIQSDIAL